jgi:hypothetical protein
VFEAFQIKDLVSLHASACRLLCLVGIIIIIIVPLIYRL